MANRKLYRALRKSQSIIEWCITPSGSIRGKSKVYSYNSPIFCPLTGAAKAKTTKNFFLGQYDEAARELGLFVNRDLVADAADSTFGNDAKAKRIRKALLRACGIDKS